MSPQYGNAYVALHIMLIEARVGFNPVGEQTIHSCPKNFKVHQNRLQMKGHKKTMKGKFRKCDQLETNHRFIIEWKILHLPHSIASCSHFTKCNPCLPSKLRGLQGNYVKDPPILRKQSIKGSLQFCSMRENQYTIKS